MKASRICVIHVGNTVTKKQCVQDEKTLAPWKKG